MCTVMQPKNRAGEGQTQSYTSHHNTVWDLKRDLSDSEGMGITAILTEMVCFQKHSMEKNIFDIQFLKNNKF